MYRNQIYVQCTTCVVLYIINFFTEIDYIGKILKSQEKFSNIHLTLTYLINPDNFLPGWYYTV